jgi:hypothetical protein
MILAAAASFFPLTRYLLQHMIPKSILEKQKQHTDFTNTKILQRLELKTARPDLITPFLNEMQKSPDKMTLGEIQSTFAIILVAGSETTATTLLGTFYKLASHPQVQDQLAGILKELFATEAEITVDSTKDIPLLDAVISEALRLCYAVPGGLPRIPQGGDVYSGHFVPGGVSPFHFISRRNATNSLPSYFNSYGSSWKITANVILLPDLHRHPPPRNLPLPQILHPPLGLHPLTLAPLTSTPPRIPRRPTICVSAVRRRSYGLHWEALGMGRDAVVGCESRVEV